MLRQNKQEICRKNLNIFYLISILSLFAISRPSMAEDYWWETFSKDTNVTNVKFSNFESACQAYAIEKEEYFFTRNLLYIYGSDINSPGFTYYIKDHRLKGFDKNNKNCYRQQMQFVNSITIGCGEPIYQYTIVYKPLNTEESYETNSGCMYVVRYGNDCTAPKVYNSVTGNCESPAENPKNSPNGCPC